MEFRQVVGWAKGHRNVLIIAALVLVIAGADLLFNRPKGDVEWFSLPLLAAGCLIFLLLFWPAAKPGPRPAGDTLARRLLWWATWHGRLVPLFPQLGLALVFADLVFNRFMSATPALLTHDLVVLLLGVALIAYRFVPERYGRERDFILLFLVALSLVLVVPLAVLRLVAGDPTSSVDAYSAAALAPQTSAILNLLGVPSRVVPVGATPGLQFTTKGGLDVTVVITSACSGVYSFAMFASAFAAFVLTEQRKLTGRVALFFALGVFLAYLANVLRMVVIVLIGYHLDTPQTGIENLLVAHSNAGWIIFLAWIALFWMLLFRFLPREEPRVGIASSPPERRGTFCGVCGIVLTPAIPATRCVCGLFYHRECLAAEGRCPKCSAPSPSFLAADGPAA